MPILDSRLAFKRFNKSIMVTLLPKTAITYPMVIFDVDISSLRKEVFHRVLVAYGRCHVQWTPLIERKKLAER